MHFLLSAFSFKNINQLRLNQEPSGFGNMFANAELGFSKGLPPLEPGLYYFISYPTPIALPMSHSPLARRGKTFYSVQQFRKPCLCLQVKGYSRVLNQQGEKMETLTDISIKS